MNDIIETLVKQPESLYVDKANCFNAIQLCWGDSYEQVFVGPEEFLAYMAKHFFQLPAEAEPKRSDVSIVWSRSSFELPEGHINLQNLLKKEDGYPFGLVIEHAYCHMGEHLVFQKLSPKLSGLYEIISEKEALAAYSGLYGYELTRHRRY